MKAIALTLALFGVTVLGIITEVPKAVINAFEKKYDNAKELSWNEESDLYQASFKHDGSYKLANFQKDGTWTKTAAALDIDELDNCLMEGVKKAYSEGEVALASFVETPDTNRYEIIVRLEENPEEEEEGREESETAYEFVKLIFSEDCEFLREEEYEG